MSKLTYREIKSGMDCRSALKSGVDQLVNCVKTTLGPYGRNNIISTTETRPNKRPVITNDGFRTASEIILDDPTENLACQAATDAAVKTNQVAGDGTTTTLVLLQQIMNTVYKRMDEKISPVSNAVNLMEYKRKIEQSAEKVIEQLKKSAKKVSSLQDLENVATVSVEDEKMGKTIAKIVQKVGADGFVDVEDTYKFETETDVIDGMRFVGSWAAQWMVNHPERKELVATKFPVLITNYEMEGKIQEVAKKLEPIIAQVRQNGYSGLIIFSPIFQVEALRAFNNALRNGFKLLGVKITSLTDEEREDLAYYTGAEFIDKTKMSTLLKDIDYNSLGKVDKIIAGQDDVVIIGGAGKQVDIDKRIEELKNQKEEEKDPATAKRIEQRIGSLAGKIGSIKVGSKTDIEKYYRRDKIIDAVHATQAAIKEGIVKGGGLALKEIGDKLPKKDLLKEALSSPYKQICANGGLDSLEIPDNVIDPLKVVLTAFENAVSLAATFITCENCLSWKKIELAEQLKKAINE